MGIADGLKSLAVPIDKLALDPSNVRVHDERNMGVIRKSLEKFGQRIPLVARRETGHVIAGNARLLAARDLGWTEVAAIFVEDDDATATAFALVDNRSSDLSYFDKKSLAEVIAALHTTDLELEHIGFNEAEVDAMIDSLEEGLVGDGDEHTPDEGTEEVSISFSFTEEERRAIRKYQGGPMAGGCASTRDIQKWAKQSVGDLLVALCSKSR